MNLTPVEFIVNVSQNIIQIFDFTLANTKFGVAHSMKGYVIFNLTNEFIGHFESDSQSGYNEFDSMNGWTRFIK